MLKKANTCLPTNSEQTRMMATAPAVVKAMRIRSRDGRCRVTVRNTGTAPSGLRIAKRARRIFRGSTVDSWAYYSLLRGEGKLPWLLTQIGVEMACEPVMVPAQADHRSAHHEGCLS
jgi:hypothetical protein